MELKTLFKRESVADPFFIRINNISFLCPILIVAYPLFRTLCSIPRPKHGGLESRFKRVGRFKNGGVLEPRKNISIAYLGLKGREHHAFPLGRRCSAGFLNIREKNPRDQRWDSRKCNFRLEVSTKCYS
jgi:hypothetical protein